MQSTLIAVYTNLPKQLDVFENFAGNFVQIYTGFNWARHPRTKQPVCANTLRPRQNGRHFADDTLKSIFLNENVWIPIEISLKFVPKGPIDNIPELV